MKKIDEIFAENVKARRKSLGYSQEKLAALAGFDISTIQRYEKPSRWPSPDEVDRLAKALRLDDPSALYQSGGISQAKPTIREALAAINSHFQYELMHMEFHKPMRAKVETPQGDPRELVEVSAILASLDDEKRRAALSMLRSLAPKASDSDLHALKPLSEHKRRR